MSPLGLQVPESHEYLKTHTPPTLPTFVSGMEVDSCPIQGRVKVGEKRLCRLLCGKPLAFRRSPPHFTPPLGWKAEPSSRAEGVGQGAGPRKGEAFPHSRRQSRFGILPFGDFDAALCSTGGPPTRNVVALPGGDVGARDWVLGSRNRKFAGLHQQLPTFLLSAYCRPLTAFCFSLAPVLVLVTRHCP